MGEWFVSPPKESDSKRLFFFPHAGGGASYYNTWSKYFKNTGISIYSIQMPGREMRLYDEKITSFNFLIDQLTLLMQPHIDKPFAFFGHSMGALIAFELTRALNDKLHVQPEHLFLSGRYSPEIHKKEHILHNLSDAELLEHLEYLGGTNKSILQNPKMCNLILPVLHSDLQICDSYKYNKSFPIFCNTTVLGSTDDVTTKVEELFEWEKHFSNNCSFTVELFDGCHFYHEKNKEEIIRMIIDKLVGTVN